MASKFRRICRNEFGQKCLSPRCVWAPRECLSPRKCRARAVAAHLHGVFERVELVEGALCRVCKIFGVHRPIGLFLKFLFLNILFEAKNMVCKIQQNSVKLCYCSHKWSRGWPTWLHPERTTKNVSKCNKIRTKLFDFLDLMGIWLLTSPINAVIQIIFHATSYVHSPIPLFSIFYDNV